MNLTDLSTISVEERQTLVEERFLPMMHRLAEEYGMVFSETPSKPEKRIVSRLAHANISFRKPSWNHCYIYFEFLRKDWSDLEYGCGYWEKNTIKDINEKLESLKITGKIRGYQQNSGGAWSRELMGRDEYRSWDDGFFKDLIENEDKTVAVFEAKLKKMLDIVKEFEHIL